MDGERSSCVKVKSGVPQGTVLGPLLFLLYINDIDNGISSQLRLFADDCLIYRPIQTDQHQSDLQKDLDKLSAWSDTWQLRFNVKECCIIHVRKSKRSSHFMYTMFVEPLEVIMHTIPTWGSYYHRTSSGHHTSTTSRPRPTAHSDFLDVT